MSLTPLATKEDLAAVWRSLEPEEESRAQALLQAASSYLRLIARNNGRDIDDEIKKDSSELLKENVKMVVVGVVKRAMVLPSDMPPVDSWSQSASPYSESMTFTNPSSDLFFKKAELQLLGLGSVGGRSKIGIVRGVR